MIDPGNLLTAENFARQDEVIEQAFELLVKRIIEAHTKDRMLLESGELVSELST